MLKVKILILLSLLGLTGCKTNNKLESRDSIISSKAVIDTDDRYEIKSLVYEAEKFYQYAVGHITTTRGDSNYSCTGSIVGESYIITAAHCVYRDGKFVDSAFFDPTILGVKKTFKWRFYIESVWVNKTYKNLDDYGSDTSSHDIAILKIKKYKGLINPVEKFGSLNIEETSTKKRNLDLKLLGYPGDKKDSTLWESECSVSVIHPSDRSHEYDCDSFSGVSGGPVIKYNENLQTNTLLGIHVGSVGFPAHSNNFVTFSSDIYKDIKQILKGEEKEIKHFSKHKLKLNPKISAIFHNKCEEDIYVAIRYKNLDLNWVTEGYYSIEPGQAFELLETKNSTYYYYAQSYNGDLKWSADKEVLVNGSTQGFKTARLSSHWQIKTHRFTCKD